MWNVWDRPGKLHTNNTIESWNAAWNKKAASKAEYLARITISEERTNFDKCHPWVNGEG